MNAQKKEKKAHHVEEETHSRRTVPHYAPEFESMPNDVKENSAFQSRGGWLYTNVPGASALLVVVVGLNTLQKLQASSISAGAGCGPIVGYW
jgi:hypothetical protein